MKAESSMKPLQVLLHTQSNLLGTRSVMVNSRIGIIGFMRVLPIPTVTVKLVVINVGANGKIGAHGADLKVTRMIIGPGTVPLPVRDAGNRDPSIASTEHPPKLQLNLWANGSIVLTAMMVTT